MAAVDVRPASRSDIRDLSRTLARAFQDDPVMAWMAPDPKHRARALPRMFATMTRHHFLAGGGSEVAIRDGIGGAALWDPPGRWKQTRREELMMLPGFLWAMGVARSARGQQLTALMKEHHPEEPHWYLAVIGSDPTVRGGGFGHALMQSRLDRVDAEHAPAYLESSNPDNVPYYLRFGFEITGEIKLPDSDGVAGPAMTAMWRAPR